MRFVAVLVDAVAIPATFAFATAIWLQVKVLTARFDRPRLWDLADILVR